MTKQQQAKAAKLVILVRYLLKQDAVVNGTFCKKGTVILRVRNGEGREYITILRRNKQHTCNCAHKPSEKCPECYHILRTKEIENARARAARKAATTLITVQEVKDVLLLPERCESKAVQRLHQDIDTYLAQERKEAAIHETARAGAQDIESRLARAGLMRR